MLVKICREKPVPIFVLSRIKDPAHRAESLKLITNKGISDRPKICMRYEQAQSLICSYMKKTLVDSWGAFQYNYYKDCSPKEEDQWQYNTMRYKNCSEVALTFMQD